MRMHARNFGDRDFASLFLALRVMHSSKDEREQVVARLNKSFTEYLDDADAPRFLDINLDDVGIDEMFPTQS